LVGFPITPLAIILRLAGSELAAGVLVGVQRLALVAAGILVHGFIHALSRLALAAYVGAVAVLAFTVWCAVSFAVACLAYAVTTFHIHTVTEW
jgi:hypothetical protein